MKNQKLIELRESMGKTQDQVSKEIGISRTMYTKIELGTRLGRYKTMKLIANYFNCSVDEIFGDYFFKQNAHKTRQSNNTA